MSDEQITELKLIVEPLVTRDGLEMVALKIHRSRGNIFVDILADHPEGGITIDECARLNRRINDVLEAGNFFGQEFSMSVGSPGIDWPLKTRKDFLRVRNRSVRVHIEAPEGERAEWTGTVQSADDDNVVLMTKSGAQSIALKNIKKGIQIIE